jgi:DNA helicase-2/ATP-dependent DNA helicase PcrA
MSLSPRAQAILANLDDDQKKVVLHDPSAGDALVIAGAGSGKTHALQNRVAFLLETTDIHPRRIIAASFTKKASNEIKDRVAAAHPRGKEIVARTTHSLAYMLLRKQGLARNGVGDSRTLNGIIKRGFGMVKWRHEEGASFVRGAFAALRTSALTRDKWERALLEMYPDMGDELVQLVAHYESEKLKRGIIDFADMPYLLWEAFRDPRHENFLGAVQRQFVHILNDETQDCNRLQFDLLRMMSEEHRGLMLIGDTRQCLPPDEPILMADGSQRRIDSVKEGDEVMVATGRGGIGSSSVKRVFSRSKRTKLYTFTLSNDSKVTVTGEHRLFAHMPRGPFKGRCYVYMMKSEMGYRLGTTNDPVQRWKAESPLEAMWLVKECDSEAEARFWESVLSLRHRIPTCVFKSREMGFQTKQWLRKFWDMWGERSRLGAVSLSCSFDLDLNEPPMVSSSNNTGPRAPRVAITIELMGAKGSVHKLRVNTNDQECVRAIASLGFPMVSAKKGGHRFRRQSTSLSDLRADASAIKDALTRVGAVAFIVERSRIAHVPNKATHNLPSTVVTPAKNIQAGMMLPVESGGSALLLEVVGIEAEDYEGVVYDLEIDRVNNFIAGEARAVVHNSLYGFRGALPERLMEFAEERQMERYFLKNNYRSHREIVEVGNDLISHGLAERDLPRSNSVKPDGATITCRSYYSQAHEAQDIARQCKELIESGVEAHEIAVLYRVNAQSQYLQLAFGQEDVPFHVIGGHSFFDKREVKDALAFLELANDPTDTDALRRIYNVPTRYLGKKFVDAFDDEHTRGDSVMDSLSRVADSTYRNRRNIESLMDAIEDLRGMALAGRRPEQMLDYVYGLTSKLPGNATFRELYISDDGADDSRAENLDALREMASGSDSLSAFLETATEQSDADEDEDEWRGKVQFLTVHRSKGLEFDTVYVVGFCEGCFPHGLGDLEEERRVAYVAITRARRDLHLCVPATRFEKPTQPSMFLAELGMDSTPVDVVIPDTYEEE